MADSNILHVNFGSDTPKEAAEAETTLDYDHQCDAMRERNRQFLDLFEKSMRDSGLAESTINRHLYNVDFYINEYLLYYDISDMEYGCHDVFGFLGDFFIRKCAWSTPGTIKENATSIKKFYKCMRDNELISADAYDELVCTIKENLADWQADCAEFNDPANYSNPFFGDLDDGAPLAESDPLTKISSLLGVDSKLEGYFKEALKEVFKQRILEEFGTELDRAVGVVKEAYPKAPVSPEPPSREEVIDMFALALFFLTSWEEKTGGRGASTLRKAWKSADQESLERLRDAGLIDCTSKAKSLALTADGAAEAELFLRALDLGHLVEG